MYQYFINVRETVAIFSSHTWLMLKKKWYVKSKQTIAKISNFLIFTTYIIQGLSENNRWANFCQSCPYVTIICWCWLLLVCQLFFFGIYCQIENLFIKDLKNWIFDDNLWNWLFFLPIFFKTRHSFFMFFC